MIAVTSKEAANVKKTFIKNDFLPLYSNHKNPSI